VEFHRPDSIDAAISVLAGDEQARCLSGGATLVAMMNAQLAEPTAIVCLKDIEELHRFERAADGSVEIGAMRLHRQTAHESDLRDAQKVVSRAAAVIANPPVRNMGTMGGSVAFADPAADYPPSLVAADAIIHIAGAAGRRDLRAEDFFIDWYETALKPGEIVTGVKLPAMPDGSIGYYDKVARVAGDFATVSVAVALHMTGATCAAIRIAVGGCGPAPVHLDAVDTELRGSTLEKLALIAAGEKLAAACDPVDDVRASAAYRRKIVPRVVQRAVLAAKDEAAQP
jgi:carbon-monoxide dehydrogenase medium subunit